MRSIRVFGLDVVLRSVERDVSAVTRANIADLAQAIVVPSHVLRNVRIGDRLERFVREGRCGRVRQRTCLAAVDALVRFDRVERVTDIAEIDIAVICAILLRVASAGALTALRDALLQKDMIDLPITGTVRCSSGMHEIVDILILESRRGVVILGKATAEGVATRSRRARVLIDEMDHRTRAEIAFEHCGRTRSPTRVSAIDVDVDRLCRADGGAAVKRKIVRRGRLRLPKSKAPRLASFDG